MAENIQHCSSAVSEDSAEVNVSHIEEIPAVDPQQPNLKWQETLIDLVASQQQQLVELTRLSRSATPASSAVEVPHTVSFKLTSYDPDNSAYSIEEWLADANKLKNEMNISDNLMIAKASEALKNRGYRYCCNWRPLCRNWQNFCDDLTVAFPDKDTPGVRAYKAVNLRSVECDSLCDYGNKKLRSISRFHDSLPWDKILSMVEYGLGHSEARAALQIQKPKSERDLLKLLSEFDARLSESPTRIIRTSDSNLRINKWKSERRSRDNQEMGYEKPKKIFKGSCFKCGRQGHQQHACLSSHGKPSTSTKRDSEGEKKNYGDIPPCSHCKKLGHTEPNCWYKHGKPKKAMVLKQ